MKNQSHVRKDHELQKDVQDAIKWEPFLNDAQIEVAARNGVITLKGSVDSYAKKLEAEKAAMNVTGVKAVAEEITVKFGPQGKKDDAEVNTSAVNALKWNWQVPNDMVKVKVQDGWITLTGGLRWNHEREAAHNAVRQLPGVTGVTNSIVLKANSQNKVEKELVEHAIARHWSISDQDILVNVLDSTVALTGTVTSLYQKRKASKVAWNTPGVHSVKNDLLVE